MLLCQYVLISVFLSLSSINIKLSQVDDISSIDFGSNLSCPDSKGHVCHLSGRVCSYYWFPNVHSVAMQVLACVMNKQLFAKVRSLLYSKFSNIHRLDMCIFLQNSMSLVYTYM